MDKSEIIKRFKFIRKRIGFSAKELSIKMGKSQSYISKIESGKIEPNFSELLNIIKLCNSNINEFFYYDMMSYNQDRELFKLIKKLDNSKKAALITLLKK